MSNNRPPADPAASSAPPWAPADYGHPLLVVISGPAGVGKTSALRRMRELGLPYHIGVTATTRPPRPGEIDGVDYSFLSEARFQALIDAGDLLEHALVHGVAYYGVPRAPIRAALAAGWDVLIPPEVQGAATIRRLVPGAVTIFLAPPSLDDLERRIRARGSEDEAAIERRLATARAELARVEEFDYLVINDEGRLDETVRQIEAIVLAERRRLHRPAVVV